MWPAKAKIVTVWSFPIKLAVSPHGSTGRSTQSSCKSQGRLLRGSDLDLNLEDEQEFAKTQKSLCWGSEPLPLKRFPSNPAVHTHKK